MLKAHNVRGLHRMLKFSKAYSHAIACCVEDS